MITVYRICRRQYVAFDGEGARRQSGRWNHDGTPVIYTAGSLALVALEVLAHTDASLLPSDLVYTAAEIPDSVKITRLALSDLPADWQQNPAPPTTKDVGQQWVQTGKTAVLAVPSTLVPIETNYLLNPGHRDFAKIQIQAPEEFIFDPRLLV